MRIAVLLYDKIMPEVAAGQTNVRPELHDNNVFRRQAGIY